MKRVGIDLGTTNTVVAVDASVKRIASEAGTILPSVVAYPPTGSTLVGNLARRRRPIDPKNTVYSSKRLIGRRWDSEDCKLFSERYPMELVQGEDGAPAMRTRAGLVSPVDVGSRILEYLCEQTSMEPGQLSGVIAVPAVFTHAQREATAAAGRQAGLAEVKLIDEPYATTLAFINDCGRNPEIVAAYDFGGGTFDVAIMNCSRVPFQVLGYAGDLYLGGDEIDAALAEWVVHAVLERDRWDLRTNNEVFARLTAECERAKIRLCDTEETTVDLRQVDIAFPGAGRGLPLGRDKLAELCLDLVRKSFLLCDEALSTAGIKAGDVEMVVLAGGTSMLPMIREGVMQYFGKEPLHHLDPMEVVATGASLAPL